MAGGLFRSALDSCRRSVHLHHRKRFYQILATPPDASTAVIKKAYRELALRYGQQDGRQRTILRCLSTVSAVPSEAQPATHHFALPIHSVPAAVPF